MRTTSSASQSPLWLSCFHASLRSMTSPPPIFGCPRSRGFQDLGAPATSHPRLLKLFAQASGYMLILGVVLPLLRQRVLPFVPAEPGGADGPAVARSHDHQHQSQHAFNAKPYRPEH